jgi:hypothetical protein
MPPILTVAQILAQLNAEREGETWYVSEVLSTLPNTTVSGPRIISLSSTGGIVVKAFINQQTAEVRLFLAKRTSIPEQPNL